MTMQWRDVIGFQGHYRVRPGMDGGAVLCVKTGKLLGLSPTKRGYLQVNFNRKIAKACGRTKTAHVHVLILEAFVGPRPHGCHGRHMDDCPANNTLDNLQWGTPAQNSQDAIRNGRSPKGRRNGSYTKPQSRTFGKATPYPAGVVRQAFGLRSQGRTYREIGEELGAPWTTVRSWLQGKSRSFTALGVRLLPDHPHGPHLAEMPT